ncbi:MAG TPA: squalene synthase HpnC [Thermogutta sp.]|nr:squalene synthase HpnC [Thermogutta sp.]
MMASKQSRLSTISPPGSSRDRDRFFADLAQFGPTAQYQPLSLRASRRYCRQLARSHYENFTVVSLFVPRDLRQHFCNIYAWCRWADDLADETGDPRWGMDLLQWWQQELLACYQGVMRHPVLVALHETVTRFNIPRDPFLDLLTAFRQDQRVFRYETFEELLDYCRHSANPVGRLILFLGRCHTPDRVMLSDQICTGLQLVNFWQDVGQDYDRGRIYIPKAECRRVGYTEEMFARREFNSAFRTLMKGLVHEAAAFLRRGRPLVAMMPRKLQIPVYLFVRGGLAIARAIESNDYDVWTHRPTLSRSKKVELMIRTVWDVLCRRYDRD